jgi:hypothetical protein
MDYIPSRRLAVNQVFTVSAMLAHNLGRELQMSAEDRERRDTSNALLAGRSRLSTPSVASFCMLVASRVPRASGR